LRLYVRTAATSAITRRPPPTWTARHLHRRKAVSLFVLGLAPFVAEPCLKLHARFSAALLSPTSKHALSTRVGVLTQTRSEVLDSSAAELRRIERDLHDGTQTRIAALGLNIGLAEQLVYQDPDAAVALLAEARESSGQALAELRSLVRGILPPVLAERGLDGAIRALVLTLPIPVEPELDLPESIPAPIESALYFAVAEALANAVKHSGATRLSVRVWLDERRRLTAREREVLAVMAEGRANAALAARLGVTEKAVSKHINNIFAKLGLLPAEDDHRRVLAVLRYLDL